MLEVDSGHLKHKICYFCTKILEKDRFLLETPIFVPIEPLSKRIKWLLIFWILYCSRKKNLLLYFHKLKWIHEIWRIELNVTQLLVCRCMIEISQRCDSFLVETPLWWTLKASYKRFMSYFSYPKQYFRPCMECII